MLQEGYLLISDISGYTAFLTQSELEHAHAVLADLFEALMTNIRLPLKIAKLEGDAIFAYARQGSYIEGLALLEGIEHLYNIFGDARTTMTINTTCTCTACRLIPTLDLKFFVHHGEFIVDKQGELSGPSIILIHRLMKNHVVEETGFEAYALFTQVAIEKMQVAEAATSMRPHVETYEHLGDVPCYVHDLAPVYKAYRERERIIVAPQDADMHLIAEVPVPPPVAWTYLNTPEGKTRIGMGSVTPVDKLMRRGVGTTHHCAHGKQAVIQRYLDYRPFEYTTYESALPMGLSLLVTTRLTPIEGGTRVEWLSTSLRGPRINALIMGLLMGAKFKADWQQLPIHFREVIANDMAGGKFDALKETPADLAAAPA